MAPIGRGDYLLFVRPARSASFRERNKRKAREKKVEFSSHGQASFGTRLLRGWAGVTRSLACCTKAAAATPVPLTSSPCTFADLSGLGYS